MRDKRLIHDHAWATAVAVVRLFVGCLREEEQAEAVREVYELLKVRLASFLELRERERRRVRGDVTEDEARSTRPPSPDAESQQ